MASEGRPDAKTAKTTSRNVTRVTFVIWTGSAKEARAAFAIAGPASAFPRVASLMVEIANKLEVLSALELCFAQVVVAQV